MMRQPSEVSLAAGFVPSPAAPWTKYGNQPAAGPIPVPRRQTTTGGSAAARIDDGVDGTHYHPFRVIHGGKQGLNQETTPIIDQESAAVDGLRDIDAQPDFCQEKFRLRGEYIRQLEAFNRAARRYLMDGNNQRDLGDAIQSSRNAWRQYRAHVDVHRGRH